jgi:hypothetical protein
MRIVRTMRQATLCEAQFGPMDFLELPDNRRKATNAPWKLAGPSDCLFISVFPAPPLGEVLRCMLSVVAEFETNLRRERQHKGIAQGTRPAFYDDGVHR